MAYSMWNECMRTIDWKFCWGHEKRKIQAIYEIVNWWGNWFVVQKVQKFPEALEMRATHAWKRNSLCKKEKFNLQISCTPQTEGMFFHLAASKVAHLSAKSWGFAYRLCLLLASQHAKTSTMKSIHFGCINHQRRLVYFNTLSGRCNFHLNSERISSPTE